VEIGSANYEQPQGDEHDTGSFAGLEEVVKGIRWQVEGFLPFGMLTGLIAQPKAGKSAFALYALARPIITGGMWFNGQFGPRKPGHVVYCDTERRAAINLARAKQWGLPIDRIKTPFKDVLRPLNLNDTTHIYQIFNTICRYKASLVIVDSFRGSHDLDENNSRIVAPLRELGRIAEETGASVVVIHHAGKMSVEADMTINAGRGSNAFLAAIAAQIAIDTPDPKPDLKNCWRRVQVLGENLGIAPKPFGFRFTDRGFEFGAAPVRPDKFNGMEKAADWLREHMRPGEWMDAKPLIDAAEDAGFQETGTLQRAREHLGITK
jgi:hypothetical protein